MAEAVALFGLAANIIQFIDLGARLATKLWSIYKAALDSKEIVPDLAKLTTDLKNILSNLRPPLSGFHEYDEGLYKLGSECHSVAVELLRLLADLSSAKQGKSTRLEAIKLAFKQVWREDEIAALQARLDGFRSQLTLHLLTSLRAQSHKTLEQQQQVLLGLAQIQQSTRQLQKTTSITSDGEAIGSLLIKLLTSKIDAAQQGEWSQWPTEFVNAILTSKPVKDDSLAASSLEISRAREARLQGRFLEKLRFREMQDRQTRIDEAHAKTFQWIFDDSFEHATWSSFKQWLGSDDQVYWITGKPGSGKSTLMKYVCHAFMPSTVSSSDAPGSIFRSRPYLEEWAGSCHLVTVTYFFWNSGVPLQMSPSGLFRSLLVQLLTVFPNLTPVIAPQQWEALCLFDTEHLSLSERELQDMVRYLVRNLPSGTKVCLFIDGLDECDGDHVKLITYLRDLLTISNVKLCAASRPWVVFEDAFHSSPSLKLQELTYNDIRDYATSHLDSSSVFLLLQRREPEYANQLIENIASKASGVFLWVKIVVISLLAGMRYGDRISDLQRRLDSLPPELEDLYEKILAGLGGFYFERAVQLFQLVQESPAPISLLLLSFADDDDWKRAVDQPVKLLAADEVLLRVDTMHRRLNACCKGLLEDGNPTGPRLTSRSPAEKVNWTVQYLHRSVKDWIECPDVQTRLNAALKPSFDPHLQLCSGTLAQLKSVYNPKFHGELGPAFWRTVSLILYSASKTRPEHSKAVVSLMDELDKSGSKLAQELIDIGDLGTIHQLNFEQQYWVHRHPRARDLQFGAHFLSLAVRYNVTAYVEARASRGCLVQRSRLATPGPTTKDNCGNEIDTRIHPLLIDALHLTTVSRDNALECVPSPNMIACLLKKGARFDALKDCRRIGLNRIWTCLLDSVVETQDGGKADEIELWREVLSLINDSGQAMPTVTQVKSYTSQSHRYYSEWDILQALDVVLYGQGVL